MGKRAIVLIAALGAALLASCSGNTPAAGRAELGYIAGDGFGAAADLKAVDTLADASKKALVATGAAPVAAATGAPATGTEAAAQAATAARERLLVKNGSAELVAEDLAKAEAAIGDMAKAAGGYVAASNRAESWLSISLRVPAPKFDAVIGGLSGVGRLVGKSEAVDDITDQYYDVKLRLDTKKILQERYSSYLKRAAKVEDLLSIERALNDLTAEIESMEGSLRQMDRDVAFSMIQVSVRLPDYSGPVSERPTVQGGFRTLWDTVVDVLYYALFVALYLVVFGLPAVLSGGLLWMLLFGKVGAVRKWFARMGKKPAA